MADLEIESGQKASQGQMFQFISHELRTPTVSILSSIECLEMQKDVPVCLKDEVDSIKTSSKMLLLLIDDVLDYSAIQNSNLSLNKRWVKI